MAGLGDRGPAALSHGHRPSSQFADETGPLGFNFVQRPT